MGVRHFRVRGFFGVENFGRYFSGLLDLSMLNKDLIKQRLSRFRRNRASERKVLLAGLVYMKCMHRGSEVFTVTKNAISKVLLFYMKGYLYFPLHKV